jgi:DNA-binding NtrC family response regulator
MPTKVLVVEDVFLIADDYRMTIEDRGWEVLGPAATSKQALGLLSDDPPNVAVLDLMLLSEVSTPIAEALLLNGIPFILASGGRDPVSIGGEAFRGIVNLGKPNSSVALILALEKALANPTQG